MAYEKPAILILSLPTNTIRYVGDLGEGSVSFDGSAFKHHTVEESGDSPSRPHDVLTSTSSAAYEADE
jgi:hypothetical protein